MSKMDLPCDVVEVVDGTQALAMGLERALALIILGITMPRLSGIKVLQRLREARPHVLVLMLCMYSSWGYVRQCLRAGAAGYLTKVSAPAELAPATHAVLGG